MGKGGRKFMLPTADRRTFRDKTSVTSASACLGYTDEDLCFLRAIDRLKQSISYRMPTWPEVLAAAKAAGFAKVEDASNDAPITARTPGPAGPIDAE